MTAKNLFNLTDRVALITGGSRGLGMQMAQGVSVLAMPNTSAAK